jgi:hypothetical protein
MANWLGRDPNCFTGADCWNYDHSDRGLLFLAFFAGITITFHLIKFILKK